jgi:hypothetical protein
MINGIRPHKVLAFVVLAASGCAVTPAQMATVVDKLKIVSAGHTGCEPTENVVSDVKASPDGSGTWIASCRGKAYLCSGVASLSGSESFSCAPLAQ